MKVGVFVGDTLPEAGGGYTFVKEIVAQIERRAGRSSHQFTLLTTAPVTPGARRPGDLEVLSLSSALPDLRLRARRKIVRTFDHWMERPVGLTAPSTDALATLLTRHGIDLVWYVGPTSIRTLDIPFITVVWDLQHRLQPFFPEVSMGTEYSIRDHGYQEVLTRASLVITGTQVGRDEIVRFYGIAPERIRVLPLPTPTFALDAASLPSPRPTAAPPEPFLYYPAQFWPHKNHVNLLEALRLLRSRDGLDISLVLSGSDKGNASFVKEAAARLGLTDAVRMLGFVSREDLIGLYRHALALTFVTFFGPDNLPPLEAFALGCPVVASDVNGAREQLGDAALFVGPTKPEEIAEAVRRLHSDEALRATLTARGHARARRFTGEDFVASVFEWLDEFAPIRHCWPTGTGVSSS